MLFYDNNKWVNESRQLLEADSITKKEMNKQYFLMEVHKTAYKVVLPNE